MKHFIIRTNLVGPWQFELSELHCIVKMLQKLLNDVYYMLTELNVITCFQDERTVRITGVVFL